MFLQLVSFECFSQLFIICLIVVLLIAVGLAIMGFGAWAVPYQRGFFCDDESISYPYRDSTVPGVVLYFVCLVIPMALVSTNVPIDVNIYVQKHANH